ncbi:hypothetical protein CDAR_569491 [Caerostris darwini]|uniref:Uncharacterized protein n=1 Tax=Caerostris darwini TaxID=1538125 RepID=A0AAV4TWU5_9ARAC|nr:hypothetical protein CDAR_569491 [Caerostris darwini]
MSSIGLPLSPTIILPGRWLHIKRNSPSFSFIDTFHRFSGHYSFSGQASNQKVTHLCQKEIQTLLYRHSGGFQKTQHLQTLLKTGIVVEKFLDFTLRPAVINGLY